LSAKSRSKPPRREILELLFLAEKMGSLFFLSFSRYG
jgi:hypothetical protein